MLTLRVRITDGLHLLGCGEGRGRGVEVAVDLVRIARQKLIWFSEPNRVHHVQIHICTSQQQIMRRTAREEGSHSITQQLAVQLSVMACGLHAQQSQLRHWTLRCGIDVPFTAAMRICVRSVSRMAFVSLSACKQRDVVQVACCNDLDAPCMNASSSMPRSL